jgi:hypothetical protein
MANDERLAILEQGVAVWNTWMKTHRCSWSFTSQPQSFGIALDSQSSSTAAPGLAILLGVCHSCLIPTLLFNRMSRRNVDDFFRLPELCG